MAGHDPRRPLRVFSNRNLGPDGEPLACLELSPELMTTAAAYAEQWKALFGRYPQGQHPLKFPVNRQIKLDDAELILEFPVDPVTFGPRGLP